MMMCFPSHWAFSSDPSDPLDMIYPYIIQSNFVYWNTLKGDSSLTFNDKINLVNLSNMSGILRMDEYINIKDRYWIKELKDNPDTKRQIVFPDKDALTVQNNDDDNINYIRYKIHKYIEKSDFESLRKIQKLYIYPLPDMLINIMNYTDRYIPYGDEEEEEQINQLKVIISLSKKFEKDKVSIDTSVLEKTIDDYVCLICRIPELPQRVPENHRIEDKRSDDLTDEIVDDTESPHILLFQDVAIYKGQSNLLYAETGVGKTMFSIEIAKSDKIKKPLFILLDDVSDRQLLRYKKVLGDKVKIIDYNEWNKRYNNEKSNMRRNVDNQVNNEVFIDSLINNQNFPNPFYNNQNFKKHLQVAKLIEKRYKQLGISDTEVLNNLFVLGVILQDAVSDGVDFICIDSLNGLMEKSCILNRASINGIIEIPSKKNITLLLVHHTNKEGEMAGSSDLKNTFENVYKLRNDKDDLFLDVEKARFGKKTTLRIARTFSDGFSATHTIISNNPENREAKTNMKSMIKEIIENYDGEILPYQELVDTLKERTGKENDEANIMKHLKSLKEKDNLIDMADGNTWKGGIKILSPESTAD